MKKGIIIALGILILFALVTSCYADNSTRIQELENQKIRLQRDLQQYQRQVDVNVRQAETKICQLDGAIGELRQQDKEEKNAERLEPKELESNARQDTGGDTP